MRLLRPLLLVFALLFSQHAALLHGLAHAEHEVALAATHDGKAPALDHSLDVCAAFGSLAHALGNGVVAPPAVCATIGSHTGTFASVPAVTRVGFDSRAPPHSA
jgi:hypothetical protein